jgi:Spy/CpxP family protein refolding chaperone
MEREMGPGGQFGRWWNNPRLVEKFKLTDQQRKTMDDIYEQHRLKLVDLHANLEKAELEMEPLMGQDQPDEAKILSQIDKVAQARAELEKANARMLLDIRKQLSPEQWKDVKTAWTERRESHGGPGNPGDGPRWHRRDGAPKDGGAAPPPQPGGPGAGPSEE